MGQKKKWEKMNKSQNFPGNEEGREKNKSVALFFSLFSTPRKRRFRGEIPFQ
jgi:hypothetical protein